jgi:hypothetical protein
MLKATYELNRLDIFTHLNGQNFQVDAIDWVGGDNYKITCIDQNDDLVTFPADVHTQFNVIFSYQVQVRA